MAVFDRFIPKALLDRIIPVVIANRRLAIAAGAALAAALVAMAVLWAPGSSYSVLFAGLSSDEGGRTIAELQKLNIPFSISEGGRVIMVPAADAGRARLQLAARGVPKQEHDDWALFDNESLSVSPFAEQVHYVRATETALARTIRDVDGVVSAKVMLALPKQTSFLADTPKPSASVMLQLRPGMQLSGEQVDGIVGLVAGSVPGMARDNVTIVDQSGRGLKPTGADTMQQLPQQLDLVREVDHRYETLVTELLTPVLGPRNFRVSADADIDFSKTKESFIKYGDSHVLSQNEIIRSHPNDVTPIGIPGALSNRPPDTPTVNPPLPQPQPPPKPAGKANVADAGDATEPTPPVPPVPADSHKTTNYDIDHTIEYREHPAWTLRGINVAVLVNNPSGHLPPDRIKSINTLVASAIGVAQNPRVTVVDLPFEDAAADQAAGVMPWWQQPGIVALRDNAVLALAGLLALFGGILPLLRRMEHLQLGLAPAATAAGAASAGTAANINVMVGSDTARPAWSMTSGVRRTTPAPVNTIEPETVRALVANDPARTAQVIKGWIADGRSSVRADGQSQ
ncbi:MAG: flagellar M-ring protein FliF [Alphaproteobacteria bacterium]|nr:flagellar M-ring protein FliF [Alphaproteobacteria bacterium]